MGGVVADVFAVVPAALALLWADGVTVMPARRRRRPGRRWPEQISTKRRSSPRLVRSSKLSPAARISTSACSDEPTGRRRDGRLRSPSARRRGRRGWPSSGGQQAFSPSLLRAGRGRGAASRCLPGPCRGSSQISSAVKERIGAISAPATAGCATGRSGPSGRRRVGGGGVEAVLEHVEVGTAPRSSGGEVLQRLDDAVELEAGVVGLGLALHLAGEGQAPSGRSRAIRRPAACRWPG